MLQLRPLNVRAAGPGLRGAKPIATDIELTADEQPVKLSRDRVSRPQAVTFDAPTAVFELHYLLRRVTVRTPNSSPGRALGAVGPLVAGVPGDLPVDVVVMGRSVRNLGCPSSEMVRRPCAAGQTAAAAGEPEPAAPHAPWSSCNSTCRGPNEPGMQ